MAIGKPLLSQTKWLLVSLGNLGLGVGSLGSLALRLLAVSLGSLGCLLLVVANLGNQSLGALDLGVLVVVTLTLVVLVVLNLGDLGSLMLLALDLSSLGLLVFLTLGLGILNLGALGHSVLDLVVLSLVLVFNLNDLGDLGLRVRNLGGLSVLILSVLNLGDLSSLGLRNHGLGGLDLGALIMFSDLRHSILDLFLLTLVDLGSLGLRDLDLGALGLDSFLVLIVLGSLSLGVLILVLVVTLGDLDGYRDKATRSIFSRGGGGDLLRGAALVKDKETVAASRDLRGCDLVELTDRRLGVTRETIEETQARGVSLSKSLTVLGSSRSGGLERLNTVVRRASSGTVALRSSAHEDLLGNSSPRLSSGRGRGGHTIGSTLLVKDVQTIVASRHLGSRHFKEKAARLVSPLDETKSKALAGVVRSTVSLTVNCSVSLAVVERMNVAVDCSARNNVALLGADGEGAGHDRSHGSRNDGNGGLHVD